MAQGGNGWPPGQYGQHVQHGQHSSAGIQHNMNASEGGIEYDQHLFDIQGFGNPPSNSQFSFDSNPNSYQHIHHGDQSAQQPYAGSNFVAGNPQHHAGVNNTTGFPAHGYYPNEPQFDSHNTTNDSLRSHQGQQQPSQFGDANYERTAPYVQAGQHELYGQFTANHPGHHNAHVPGGFSATWQEPLHSVSPSPYSQQGQIFENHIVQQPFQHQMRAPQSNVPTPPPSQRNTQLASVQGDPAVYQAPVNAMNPRSDQSHLSPQPPQHHQQYPQHYQFARARQEEAGSPYNRIASSSPQTVPGLQQPGYPSQHQTQFAGQLPPSNSPAPTLATQPASAGTRQGSIPAQFSLQQRSATGSPLGVGGQRGADFQMPHYASPQPSKSGSGTTPSMIGTPGGRVLGPVQSKPLDLGPDWSSVQGCPSLLVKETPGRLSNTADTRKYSSYTAKHNSKRSQLLPTRPNRLPCELRRDKNELSHQLEAYAPADPARQQIAIDMVKVEKEMISLTGSGVPKEDSKRKIKRRVSSSESATESSEYDSDVDENDPNRQAREIMSAAKRPSDPIKGVEHDVVRIIWRDLKNPRKEQEVILDFAEYIAVLWAEVKLLRKRLETAQEKKDKEATAQHQSALARQYQSIQAAIETATKFGDKLTLRHMGTHEKLVTILYNALRVPLTAKDYNGPFAKAILHFMSQITTIDKKFLVEKLKMDKLRNKYINDLDELGRKYMNQIWANADEWTAKQRDSSDDTKRELSNVAKKPTTTTAKGPTLSSKGLPSKEGVPSKKPASEIKKLQPTDYSGLGSARKVSNGSAKSNISGSPAKRPRDDEMDSRAPKKVAVEGAAGALATVKTAQSSTTSTTQARPRPSGSLLLGKSRTTVRVPPKKSEPQPSSTSTISGLLAEIAKPAEKPKKREEPARAPETPEEKARRLRKESRRKLRVMWKPDDELVQYRVFEHDSTEDEGRASNMVRDARDNRSEGQMLKRGVQEKRGSGEEEDDEDGNPKEVNLRDWVEPTLIDCSVLGPEQREKTFVTRGGLREVSSDQQRVMKEYEDRELMAIYTTLSEIPQTPRSPPSKAIEASTQPTVAFLPADKPKLQEVHRRWTEVGQFGGTAAQHLALQRLSISLPTTGGSQSQNQLNTLLSSIHGIPVSHSHHSHLDPHANVANRTSAQGGQGPQMKTQEERDAEVLALLMSYKTKNYVDPDPYDPANPKTQQRHDYADPKVQQAANSIEAVVTQIQGKPFPPTEPPEWLKSNPDRVKEWHTGRNNDIATKAKMEANERATKFAEDYQRKMAQDAQVSQPAGQPNAYAPYQAQPLPSAQYQPQHQFQQTPQGVPDQFAAILQQVQALQGNQQPAPQHTAAPTQPTPAPVQPDNGLQSLLAALSQSNQAAQAPAQQAAAPQNPDYAYWQWVQNQAQAYGAQPQQPQAAAQSYGAQYDGASYDGQSYGGQDHHSQSQGGHNQRDGSDRGNRKDFQRGGGGNKDHNKGINRALIGTKPCSFWAKGQCAKGDKCTFRHDPNDLK